MRLLLALLLAATLCGCGTCVNLFLNDSDTHATPFGGTALAWGVFTEGGPFGAIVGALDLPLSLAADVAMLPSTMLYGSFDDLWPGRPIVGWHDFEHHPPDPGIKPTLTLLERDLDQNMSPQMTTSWRVYLDKGNGVKNSWLLDSELLIENGRRELWSITRKPGEIGFSFSLDPNNDAPNRYVIRRPARSANYLHVPCHDGEVFTIDQFGNLEYRSYFPFETSNEPVATDRFILVSADTDRFFYAWDVVNNRYQKRRRMDEISSARSVVGKSRVFLAGDDGQIHALSLKARDFFEVVWKKKSFSEVVSPLKLNVEAAQLYVATRPDGVVTCYSTHDGEILWSRPTGCEIEDEMLVDTRYRKDRIYVITRNGEGVNGIWAIKTIDPTGKREGSVLWKYTGADKILALGKEHVYVRTGAPGAYKIAIVRTADGTLEREFSVPRLIQQRGLWYTNPFGPQLIIGVNYRGKVGMWLSLTEAE